MPQVEAPHIGALEQGEVRRGFIGAIPPQPQDPRLAPTIAALQAGNCDQDQRPAHDGAVGAVRRVVLSLRVQPRLSKVAPVPSRNPRPRGCARPSKTAFFNGERVMLLRCLGLVGMSFTPFLLNHLATVLMLTPWRRTNTVTGYSELRNSA